jgi:hypothetical protein
MLPFTEHAPAASGFPRPAVATARETSGLEKSCDGPFFFFPSTPSTHRLAHPAVSSDMRHASCCRSSALLHLPIHVPTNVLRVSLVLHSLLRRTRVATTSELSAVAIRWIQVHEWRTAAPPRRPQGLHPSNGSGPLDPRKSRRPLPTRAHCLFPEPRNRDGAWSVSRCIVCPTDSDHHGDAYVKPLLQQGRHDQMRSAQGPRPFPSGADSGKGRRTHGL